MLILMTSFQQVRARTAVGYGDNSTVITVETPESLAGKLAIKMGKYI